MIAMPITYAPLKVLSKLLRSPRRPENLRSIYIARLSSPSHVNMDALLIPSKQCICLLLTETHFVTFIFLVLGTLRHISYRSGCLLTTINILSLYNTTDTNYSAQEGDSAISRLYFNTRRKLAHYFN